MYLQKRVFAYYLHPIAIVFGAVRVDIMDTIKTLPERKGKRDTGVHILMLRNYRGEKIVFLIIHKKPEVRKNFFSFIMLTTVVFTICSFTVSFSFIIVYDCIFTFSTSDESICSFASKTPILDKILKSGLPSIFGFFTQYFYLSCRRYKEKRSKFIMKHTMRSRILL